VQETFLVAGVHGYEMEGQRECQGQDVRKERGVLTQEGSLLREEEPGEVVE
jgi:hypothetical protein